MGIVDCEGLKPYTKHLGKVKVMYHREERYSGLETRGDSFGGLDAVL